mgnify:CR=1 FL=1
MASRAPRVPPVHLHACGDDHKALALRQPAGGSPPRVWRRHRSYRQRTGSTRFTSTRVETTGPRPGSPWPPSVHLHACGDDAVERDARGARRGSPPRVWRRHLPFASARALSRFTSTRVETTANGRCGGFYREVHLHACGDDGTWGGVWTAADGSPPRVWRRQGSGACGVMQLRFTSTRVETT